MIQTIIITLFFILASFNSICQADDKAWDRATLRGIQAVIVKIHSWEPEWHAELICNNRYHDWFCQKNDGPWIS